MTFTEMDQPLDFNVEPEYHDDIVDHAPEAWELIDGPSEDSPVNHFVTPAELPDVLHSYVSKAFVGYH